METSNPEMGWTLIMRASDLIRSYATKMGDVSMDRITMAQQNVLAAVYSHDGPGIRVKDIAAKLHLTSGAVSQTVETLVREGILERVPDELDRRAVMIRLSTKGIKIREKIALHIGQIMREVLAEVDERDTDGFLKVINLVMEKVSDRYATLKQSVRLKSSERITDAIRMKTVTEGVE